MLIFSILVIIFSFRFTKKHEFCIIISGKSIFFTFTDFAIFAKLKGN